MAFLLYVCRFAVKLLVQSQRGAGDGKILYRKVLCAECTEICKAFVNISQNSQRRFAAKILTFSGLCIIINTGHTMPEVYRTL